MYRCDRGFYRAGRLIGEVITSNHTVDEVLTLYQAMQVVAMNWAWLWAWRTMRLRMCLSDLVSRTEPPH